jgi:hypothetical protein
VLGEDHLGDPGRLVVGVALTVGVLAIEEGDHVGVLLDLTRLAQVGEDRPRRRALLRRPRELRDADHRHVELAGEDLQAAAHLPDLLDPVGASVVGAHQLQVVDDDQPEAAIRLLLRVQPPRLGPQVEDPEVGGVVEPQRSVFQLLAGPDDLGPVLLRHLALAQPVARDPRPAGDEALGQLHLRHLQREEGHRRVLLQGDVLGDVGDPGALSHRGPRRDHDQVPGLEATGESVDVLEPRRGPGQLALAAGELLQAVELVAEDLVQPPEVARLLLVGDLKQQPLGVLGQLARVVVALAHPFLDPLAGAEQTPQQRVLLHDLGVVLGISGGRHLGRELGDVVLAARVLDLRALRKRLDHGQNVDRLRALVEAEDRREDQPVLVEVEVLGPQLHLVDHPGQGGLGQQHRAQNRGLGLEVLGGHGCCRGLRHCDHSVKESRRRISPAGPWSPN